MDTKQAHRLDRIRRHPGRGGCGIVALAELRRGPSHELIRDALQAIACMEHRGGCLGRTGDGAGLLFRPERSFFERFLARDRPLPEGETLVVGSVFLRRGESGLRAVQREFDGYLRREGLEGVQQLLDEAIIDLSGAAVPGGPSGDDLIFGGDGAKWVATARALKARYFMHLTKRDDQAASKALAEIGQAFGSTADQPNFAWESNINSNNPLAKFGLERPNTLIIDSRFGQALIDREDPRKDFYVAEPEPGTFQYFQSGNSNLVWVQNNSVIPIISYAELKFLEAEALLRTGADDATISAALEAAITATMDQIGIDPAVYADYVAANSDVSGLGGFEEKLEKIITEAYYGYYGYAFQQIWTNFRRTGYPDLTPSPNGSNGVNPSGVVPRRFLYPNSEDNTNSENLNAARSRQNGALLDADTWAFE